MSISRPPHTGQAWRQAGGAGGRSVGGPPVVGRTAGKGPGRRSPPGSERGSWWFMGSILYQPSVPVCDARERVDPAAPRIAPGGRDRELAVALPGSWPSLVKTELKRPSLPPCCHRAIVLVPSSPSSRPGQMLDAPRNAPLEYAPIRTSPGPSLNPSSFRFRQEVRPCLSGVFGSAAGFDRSFAFCQRP